MVAATQPPVPVNRRLYLNPARSRACRGAYRESTLGRDYISRHALRERPPTAPSVLRGRRDKAGVHCADTNLGELRTQSRALAVATWVLCQPLTALCLLPSGISRDNWHKRRKTGGKRKPYHKKRKYELGRPPANTKIGPRRIHTVRVRGGNKKYRALRLDVGNFSWGSECCTRKTRIIDVVYNASNNELVRTKTLVKNCIVLIDSTPYRQWYEAHYALPLGRKKGAKLTPEEEEILNKKRSKKIQKKYDERKKNAKIASILEEQFQQGKLLACIASRPGQCGRADGYVLEGKELEFYLRKIKARKGK
ncbi:PREDICTED: 40S ribosomal protein S8 [Calidris pugnax]|uniref:40S ribosomal protein S8 n=1 Tax=Calidris pugnax TaxID=198806 RepID=UPI00071E54EA|nr:PREDICTED: 40S ribosomal protein S8 [Calidris pugnax]